MIEIALVYRMLRMYAYTYNRLILSYDRIPKRIYIRHYIHMYTIFIHLYITKYTHLYYICTLIYTVYYYTLLYIHCIYTPVYIPYYTHRMHKKSAGLEDAFRLYLASRTLPAIHALLTVYTLNFSTPYYYAIYNITLVYIEPLCAHMKYTLFTSYTFDKHKHVYVYVLLSTHIYFSPYTLTYIHCNIHAIYTLYIHRI